MARNPGHQTRARRAQPFSLGTQQALLHNSPGYAGESGYDQPRIEALQREHGLDQIHRFDLGQNSFGCAPQVAERYSWLMRRHDLYQLLKEYPAADARALKERLAELHAIAPSWVIPTAGVEHAIGLIAAAFCDPGDRVLTTLPTFFVFDNFSRRVGAVPVHIHLRAHDRYRWTERTGRHYQQLLGKLRVKLVWLASPNNPTGRTIPPPLIEPLVTAAERECACVVLDEAYGEYCDPAGGVRSAGALLGRYPNLIVLRTFSKAYGLASLRVGYALTSSAAVRYALRAQGYNYPVARFSYELASCALDHLDHLEQTRARTRAAQRDFLARLKRLPSYEALESDCCILMLRHHALSAAALARALERRGLLTARIPGAGEVARRYLRVSLGAPAANAVLLEGLAALEDCADARPDDLKGAA